MYSLRSVAVVVARSGRGWGEESRENQYVFIEHVTCEHRKGQEAAMQFSPLYLFCVTLG